MGNYAIEYYAEDAVFPAENQVLDGVDYGPTGADFTGTVLIGAGVGYPAVGNVRLSVVYGESNEFIGTLALPTVGQVESGVGYGASGTEFTGTLVAGGGGGLTGDYTLTVTVTDADDSAPIENATVTLSRTGQRGAELTNVSGVATVGLDAATWTWIVRAPGYESRTGTIVIADDAVLSVEMDGIVGPSPADYPPGSAGL
jgi:hypothetical protein